MPEAGLHAETRCARLRPELCGAGGRDLGAYRVRVAVVEVGEDRQRLPPGVQGRFVVADGVVTVAEAIVDRRFEVSVAEPPVDGERCLVVGGRLGVLAEVVMDVPEAVPGGALPVELPDVLIQVQGPLTGDERLLMVSAQRFVPADVVERVGASPTMAEMLEQVQGLPCLGESFGMPAALLL